MTAPETEGIERCYEDARKRYDAWGVDTDRVLTRMGELAVSIHCWQGDDVGGFESLGEGLDGGGIQATGNYPGKARTIDELRRDFSFAHSLIPGSHRFNLHAMYGDFRGAAVARDEIGPEHFETWIEWARAEKVKLDFNGTFFAHPMAETGFTLSSRDQAVRQYWIRHGRRCREIGAEMGRALGSPSVVDVWIPDGYKDLPADRHTPRAILRDALDAVFEEDLDPEWVKDAVECKLFGLGSESYVVGSHEFYLGYATSRQKMLCLDAGHFHPTEVVSD